MAGGDLSPSASLWAYTGLVVLVAATRVAELAVARRHERSLAARGGHPVADGHYPLMVGLHTAFLVACAAEPWVARRPFVPGLAAAMLGVVVVASTLRWWTVATLGDRWTTRVWVVPGEGRRGGGPYRFLRHPNYLAVAVEVVALPLVHTAWITATGFGVADLWLLAHRVRAEEAALAAAEAAGGGLGGEGGNRPGGGLPAGPPAGADGGPEMRLDGGPEGGHEDGPRGGLDGGLQ